MADETESIRVEVHLQQQKRQWWVGSDEICLGMKRRQECPVENTVAFIMLVKVLKIM